MTFHPNIPQPGDDPSNSQADLLDNFGKINTDFQVNHVPLTSGGNSGFHTFVQYSNVLSSNPVIAGLQSALFPKLGSSGNPELFFSNGNNFPRIVQMTNLTVANGTITLALQSNPCQITSPNHGLTTGDQIVISDVLGMINLNGNTYTVTVLNANQFTLNGVNATLFPAYTSGGFWVRTSTVMTKWGIYTPWGITFNFGFVQFTTGAGNLIPFAIPYTSTVFTLQATAFGTLSQTAVNAVTTINFRGISSVANVSHYYLAIGR